VAFFPKYIVDETGFNILYYNMIFKLLNKIQMFYAKEADFVHIYLNQIANH